MLWLLMILKKPLKIDESTIQKAHCSYVQVCFLNFISWWLMLLPSKPEVSGR